MKKVLFIHHSTGGNLIRQGRVRDEIKKLDPDIEFWDHSYNLYKTLPLLFARFTNYTGLTDNQGHLTKTDYDIVLSNNSPREYAEIFARKPTDPTLQSILTYDVIAFKNCFPTTKITSEEQLEKDIEYYKSIRENLAKYPEKQFILLTPPPERQERTTAENAQRAMKLIHWLTSQEFVQGTANIHVFDFFGLLADDNGFLKPEYTPPIPIDSHPNKKANATIAPIFAKFVVEVANA